MSMMWKKLLAADAGGAAAAGLVFVEGQVENQNQSSYGAADWSATTIGAAPTGGNRRYVVVAFATDDGSSHSINSATFGGVSMTSAVSVGSSMNPVNIFYLEVSSGTSGQVACSISLTCDACAFALWTIETDSSGLTVPATDNTLALSVSTNVDDAAIGVYNDNDNDTGNSGFTVGTSRYNPSVDVACNPVFFDHIATTGTYTPGTPTDTDVGALAIFRFAV